VDGEISVSSARWRCGLPLPRAVEGDRAKQGDADLRGVDQPRPCAHADRNPSAAVGIAGGPVSQGKVRVRMMIPSKKKKVHQRVHHYTLSTRPPEPDDDFEVT